MGKTHLGVREDDERRLVVQALERHLLVVLCRVDDVSSGSSRGRGEREREREADAPSRRVTSGTTWPTLVLLVGAAAALGFFAAGATGFLVLAAVAVDLVFLVGAAAAAEGLVRFVGALRRGAALLSLTSTPAAAATALAAGRTTLRLTTFCVSFAAFAAARAAAAASLAALSLSESCFFFARSAAFWLSVTRDERLGAVSERRVGAIGRERASEGCGRKRRSRWRPRAKQSQGAFRTTRASLALTALPGRA